MVGGSDGTASLATVEVFDPATQSWSFGPVLRFPRANVGVVTVGQRLFAVGGFSGKAFLDSVEYLTEDGNEWCSFLPPPEEPVKAPPPSATTEKMNNADQRLETGAKEKIPCVANANVDTKAVKKPQNTSVKPSNIAAAEAKATSSAS